MVEATKTTTIKPWRSELTKFELITLMEGSKVKVSMQNMRIKLNKKHFHEKYLQKR